MKCFFIICIALSIMGCKSNGNQVKNQKEQILLNSWKISHEEHSEGIIILRPSNYSFPPSRMREEYIFHPDNTLTLKTLGPTDKPENKYGKWEWLDNGTLKITLADRTAVIWRIEEMNEEVIKISL